jgi:hypothetical protein
VGEVVPDGFAFAVFVPGAFDLLRSGRGSKNEFFGKLERRELHRLLEQFAGKRRAGQQNVKEAAAPSALVRNSRRFKWLHLPMDSSSTNFLGSLMR